LSGKTSTLESPVGHVVRGHENFPAADRNRSVAAFRMPGESSSGAFLQTALF
jgi:hypothetical protein